MKKNFFLTIILILLLFYTMGINGQIVETYFVEGELFEGGDIYFVNAKIEKNNESVGEFYLTYFSSDYFSELSLTQLNNDLSELWKSHISINETKKNLVSYQKPNETTYFVSTNPSFSLNEAIVLGAEELYGFTNITIVDTLHIDNLSILSSNLSNEDGHVNYNNDTNQLIAEYTYEITDYIEFLLENGQEKEYVFRTFDLVSYNLVGLEVTLNYVDSPKPTPTPSPEPSPSPTTSPEHSPTPTNSPEPLPSTSPQPSPSASPSTQPSPSPSPAPSQVIEDPDKDDKDDNNSNSKLPTNGKESVDSDYKVPDRYENLWIFITLQVAIVLLVIAIIISQRKKN